MVNKHSKEVVDNLLNSVYGVNIKELYSYEKGIIEIMVDLKCSLGEALDVDFDMHEVDTNSVIDMVDYLEKRLDSDLDKVNLLMQVYTGKIPDFELTRL